jgi:Conserved protein/domain typically associated with flavoprotein oxygenases, DIM6/NTAB family
MERFKEIMREVPSSVVIITTMWRGEPVGMTVNTFNSVSLDPLLVMFMADRRKGTKSLTLKAGSSVLTSLTTGIYLKYLLLKTLRRGSQRLNIG